MNLNPGFQIKPDLEDKFQIVQVKEIIHSVLTETLLDKSYSSNQAGEWSKQISDEVNRRIADLKMERYKHVVSVMLGQKMGAGCKYLARCRFDAETDAHCSQTFSNETIFAIVTVFGVYLY